MTDKELTSYINRINQNKYKDTIFLRQIGNNVMLAKVWKNKPKANDNRLEHLKPFTIFFINNNDGFCIGAVLDMGQDLHWLIIKKHRGQGYLTRSMRELILPYLRFKMDREEQQITISKNAIGTLNYNKSKKVALSLGFSPTKDEENQFSINLLDQDFNTNSIEELNLTFEAEHLKSLQNKFMFHFKNLEMISNELQMNFGNDMELSEYLDEIRLFKYKIEDVFHENL